MTSARRRTDAALRSLGIAAFAFLLAIGPAQAEIANEATAGASHAGRPVVSGPSRVLVPVTPGQPAMSATLDSAVEGDAVVWTVRIGNDGTLTLKGIVPRIDGVTLACGPDSAPGIDALPPGETASCAGRQALADTQPGPDGVLAGRVAVAADGLAPLEARAELLVALVPSMRITQSVASVESLFPGIYRVEFLIEVENNGTTPLTGIAIANRLGLPDGVAPMERPRVAVSGFTGTGGADPAHDGVANTQLLTGDVRLAPGRSGQVRVALRFDAGFAATVAASRARATSAEIAQPVESDEARLVIDEDGDGAIESATADRDGDGIPDAADADATGYFYCETDGRIMPGGRIMVENLSTGQLQSGEGSSAGIEIDRDGSDGSYRFRATEPGRYRLRFRLPPGGTASIDRLAGPPLTLADLARDTPAVLGSTQAGRTRALADFSAVANPFRLEFEIREGDPPLIGNNIPLRFCGTPGLEAAMSIAAGPSLQADGRSRATYRVGIGNGGSERADEVQARADLAQAFGAGNYELVSTAIVSAPADFAAVANPYFDGSGNTALLTSGAKLAPGERVTLDLTVLVSAPEGAYEARIIATGLSPLDASALKPAAAGVRFDIGGVAQAAGIAVEAGAQPAELRAGGRASYLAIFAGPRQAPKADLVGQMPPGFVYLDGSARLDGAPTEPERAGRELVWRGVAIGPDRPVILAFDLAAGAAATGNSFVGHIFARDANGAIISDIARVTQVRERESIFDCAEVAGRVFDDRNRDGYMQEGEPGIAGATVRIRSGFATTDRLGDYVIPCPLVPPALIGGPVAVELDVQSLPHGYRISSPNPREAELQRGRTARANFGAASLRLVAHILDDAAFEPASDRLKPASLTALANLLNLLEDELSVLRLTYVAAPGDERAEGRLDAARDLVARAWTAKARPYALTIETATAD